MIKKSPKVDIINTIITHAELLAVRHQNYVGEFVTRANSELYAILAEILKLHETLIANPKRDRLIKLLRRNLKDNFGIKTQAKTKTTALVVKYITRASRKTAHVYGRVLDIAIGEGITSNGLVDYIKRKGGIDKVRKAVVSAESAQHHKDTEKLLQVQMRNHLAKTQIAIGNVSLSSKVPVAMPSACDVYFHHLLCNFNTTTNQYEIVAVMYPSCTLETQSLSEYLTMLEVAASSDNEDFYDKCKLHGLDMDLIHRWMRANCIADAESARATVNAFISNIKLQRSNKLKLAA